MVPDVLVHWKRVGTAPAGTKAWHHSLLVLLGSVHCFLNHCTFNTWSCLYLDSFMPYIDLTLHGHRQLQVMKLSQVGSSLHRSLNDRFLSFMVSHLVPLLQLATATLVCSSSFLSSSTICLWPMPLWSNWVAPTMYMVCFSICNSLTCTSFHFWWHMTWSWSRQCHMELCLGHFVLFSQGLIGSRTFAPLPYSDTLLRLHGAPIHSLVKTLKWLSMPSACMCHGNPIHSQWPHQSLQ